MKRELLDMLIKAKDVSKITKSGKIYLPPITREQWACLVDLLNDKIED